MALLLAAITLGGCSPGDANTDARDHALAADRAADWVVPTTSPQGCRGNVQINIEPTTVDGTFVTRPGNPALEEIPARFVEYITTDCYPNTTSTTPFVGYASTNAEYDLWTDQALWEFVSDLGEAISGSGIALEYGPMALDDVPGYNPEFTSGIDFTLIVVTFQGNKVVA